MKDADKNDFEVWVPPEERELRTEFRLTGRVRVDIEVEAADAEGRSSPRMLRCATRDLSANGISVNAPEALPEKALLPVLLTIDDDLAFTLMAEVRWCQRAEAQDGYQVGLHILPSDETAFLEWKEAIAQLMASS